MAVLQPIDTETIISARMAKFKALWASYDPPNAAQYDVEGLEFDPIKIQAELGAFFELLVRDRVNQAARAVTLAYAIGSDLDAIGSRYPYGVTRQLGESDRSYRTRLWLSPSIFSLNGPGQGTFESYVFWALSAPMTDGKLRHAAALTRRGTGQVIIPIMRDDNTASTFKDIVTGEWVTTYSGSPLPTDTQVSEVYEYINDADEARKGLTDILYITKPKLFRTNIRAAIKLFPGVDRDSLMTETMDALKELVEAIRWLGADLTNLALKGAMAQAGVYNVDIKEPASDIVTDQSGCVLVSEIRLSYSGVGE